MSILERLQNKEFIGVILYEGPSKLDGKPIVAIATRILAKSTNPKTGAMVQTFILRSDITPMDAIRTGEDASICGACPHRPIVGGKCYVKVWQSPRSVFGAFERGRYARVGVDFDASELPALFAGRSVRIGSYGDPAAVPFAVWKQATAQAKVITGYTHQWKRFTSFRHLCMASVDNPAERAMAVSKGFRTFRVKTAAEPKLKFEFTCPASKEAGAVINCNACGACGGLASKNKATVSIDMH